MPYKVKHQKNIYLSGKGKNSVIRTKLPTVVKLYVSMLLIGSGL